MMRRNRLIVGIWLFAFVVAAGEPAEGGIYTDFTQEELRSLPRLCLAQRFINDELETPAVPAAEREALSNKLGHSYLHYHHYCWAMLQMRRAARPEGEAYYYRNALQNLNYVIERADPDFALLQNVYFKKGKVLERLGERKAAAVEYQNALRVKPAHAAACAALVQIYLDQGDFAAAQAALTEGLKHAPDSKTLAAKKADLEASGTR
jgi:tetratricopeptide (TPR) repeat protein